MSDRAQMSPLQAPGIRTAAMFALGVFFSALAAAPAARASATEVADLVNYMRAGPSRCGARPGLQHFVRRPELDRAAAMLVSGVPMQESVRAAGYQAVPVKGINVSGSTDGRALETLLANGYCPFIVDPGMVEMGVHQQGTNTWVLLAGDFAPARGMDDHSLANRMLTLVNDARAQGRHCGATYFPAARPVAWNESLARAARSHSEDMARYSYFSHTSRDGLSPSDRVERAGYNFRGTAENIAAGQMTPEAVMAGWIASPGHCANLMDALHTDMGVALASNRHSQMGAYWTQEFASPMRARPTRPSRTKTAAG